MKALALQPADRPLRIGILETDRVREPFIGRHGNYSDMFHRLLGDAASAQALPAPAFHDFDVRQGQYPQVVDDCDGYLITGSRHSVYDPLPWIPPLMSFVRELHQRRHKLIGICFGHQLIAQALGGETRRAEVGWAVGVHASRLLATPPWLQPPAEAFALLSSHQDQVTRLPVAAQRLAESDICPVAAFTIGDHILALQGHPEFNKPYAGELLDYRRERLGEAVYATGVASMATPIHSERVAAWMLAFLCWHADGNSDREGR